MRIGNAASTQLQLDVYGEVMDALYQEMHLGLARPNASWDIQRALVDAFGDDLGRAGREHLGGARRLPAFHLLQGDGLGRLDRAIRGAEEFNLPGRLDQWRALRQRIHDSVCREGFNAEKNSFVQYLWRR